MDESITGIGCRVKGMNQYRSYKPVENQIIEINICVDM